MQGKPVAVTRSQVDKEFTKQLNGFCRREQLGSDDAVKENIASPSQVSNMSKDR